MEWENSMGHLKGRWWEWSGIKSVEVLETSQVCSFATQAGPCPEKVRKDQRERQTTPDQGLLFSCRVVSDSLWPPWTAAHQASLSFTVSWSFLRFMSVESVMPSNYLILCCLLLLLPSIFPSIRVFSSELVLHIRWPKYRNFSFSISPSIEYSGLISFRIDWLDLLAIQRTLKSLLQHHNSKASILWRSAFLWSSSYIHTWLLEKLQKLLGKTIVWTRRTFVSKVMSLLFNALSRFVITFLPGSKHLLIPWLQWLWNPRK